MAIKHSSLVVATSLTSSKFWLLAIAAGLIMIQITLTSRAQDASLLGNSVLYWVAVGSLVWTKRNNLKLESGIFGSLLGIALIALVLLKSLSVSGYDPFLRIAPLLSALGLGLLASGLKDVRQYWQELIVLCFLAPSPGALAQVIDISELTARSSTFILWYAGFDAYRQGLNILLPNGGIEVYPGCSGLENILHLEGLAILFLMMFPARKLNWVIVPTVAAGLAYLVNSIRVAIMAVLADSSNASTFEYWHKGDGSMVFSTASVLIFGFFCLFLLRQEELSQDELED